MLTIEVKVNGRLVAHAGAQNVSELANVSNYHVTWSQAACPDLGIEEVFSEFVVKGHRRRQTAWALVARVVLQILGQMTGEPEGKG